MPSASRMEWGSGRLADASVELERILTRGGADSPRFPVCEIRCETVRIAMRDGVRLATDIYFPSTLPAPAVAMRTPYGRASDKIAGALLAIARRGYVVVSQDCRGTGDSEPDSWEYYIYEPEDGYDLVAWICRQEWFDGFLGACGGSYVGQTQWQMAMHPCMSTIVPEVSGLGVAINTTRLHMLMNAYARSVGKGAGKVTTHYSELERLMTAETMAGGYFNQPLYQPFSEALLARYRQLHQLPSSTARDWLWEKYCALSCAERATFVKEALGVQGVSVVELESLSTIFGHRISHDRHTLPHPSPDELCRSLHAPALLITGWYDWGLNDALATWELISRNAQVPMRARSRLIITPAAHNMPGYHEGMDRHSELQRAHRTENQVALLLRWYEAIRERTTDAWPTVIYYLMGANEWRTASHWPPPETQAVAFYLGCGGTLDLQAPSNVSEPDRYTYDPNDPTPTVGGSIVSYVYLPGSVDVSEVQRRSDVLTYTTPPLEHDLDIAGPLRLILYASSSAVDTDFSARLSDVFPDGRAIQLQNGILRTRYRNLAEEPQLMEPGQVYCLEIDLWATANRFRRGHRIRLDISSADFPRFDRNTNHASKERAAIPATQTLYHDSQYPSHLLLPCCNVSPSPGD